MSPSEELELLASESLRSDHGGANILTCFGVFGVDGGGADFGGGEGCRGGCWDGGTHAVSSSEGGLGAGLGST